MDKILKAVNRSLEKHKLVVNKGIKVDASLTASPHSPKGKPTYQIAQDRQEDELDAKETAKQDKAFNKVASSGADHQGRWVKKGGKLVFGYKKQEAVDENGLVLAVHTTTANTHDSKGLARGYALQGLKTKQTHLLGKLTPKKGL